MPIADALPDQTEAATAPLFAAFAPPAGIASPLRHAITAAYRRPETHCLPGLIADATLEAGAVAAAAATTRRLVEALRAKRRGSGMEGLVQEYALSSREGVALMCLAEALLRIPDAATRDALIRDKIATGDWRSHVGDGRSLFVNAATWGLVVTGKLTSSVNETALSSTLSRLVARCGEPIIRKGVDMALRLMGEQFVTGKTIEAALGRSRRMEDRGFSYSFDMLGEAAKTAADADRYVASYAQAIDAIGRASAGRGIYRGPGISIKLSALHPRYSRAQAARVFDEMLPRVKALAVQARRYDIGFNIDAEEADRLDLSLDILEALSLDPDLFGWHGLGFVVQAYGKRCPFVIDFIVDLARRSGHRLMVRLVKGAYWDAEIKRAQVEGLEDFPVYTRKIHTDVSYIACAKKLLAARAVVFPQFATHNAGTLATVHAMAGTHFVLGDYEFQCLHGMGEPLYDEVVGPEKLDRPCRIYAPVGRHETLLAYLVRRLLENGANSSFVNRIADPTVSIDALIADPVASARRIDPVGAMHAAIVHPRDLFAPARRNSCGLDLSDEDRLGELSADLIESLQIAWTAAPLLARDPQASDPSLPIRNPADIADIVGFVSDALPEQARSSIADAMRAAGPWAAVPVAERAACLIRASDVLQARMPALLGLLVREGGKTVANAIAEVREAVDFLRYYACEAQAVLPASGPPLGPIVCISPWNFPLAIFIGQVAAALVAGNPVLAKPAEETPLIAAQAVALLHEAGIPRDVLQFLPGNGAIGAALIGDPAIAGVMFTGSTDVARLIQRRLANPHLTPLIAETGGQNVMIADSSALAEQVVGDAIFSAFDSAGQRCSALRVLCLQDEIADGTLAMLKGAMRELAIGRPDRLAIDVGPVISQEAKDRIEAHIAAMRARGHRVEQLALPAQCDAGFFVAPTLIEIGGLGDLSAEVFGPVLHVMRFRRDGLDALVDAINATGYGLTFGLHTRLDETIDRVRSRVAAGNVYINRNMVGAIVGSQPFGGSGLSGTGPKAGGPLYLRRLVHAPCPLRTGGAGSTALEPLRAFIDWLGRTGHAAEAKACQAYADRSLLGLESECPGPVGECNLYATRPRGTVLLVPETQTGLFLQIGAVLASGNRAVIDPAWDLDPVPDLPVAVRDRLRQAGSPDAALVEGAPARCREIAVRMAGLEGAIISVQGLSAASLASGEKAYALEWLFEEISTSIDTTAAGGNASLMTIG